MQIMCCTFHTAWRKPDRMPHWPLYRLPDSNPIFRSDIAGARKGPGALPKGDLAKAMKFCVDTDAKSGMHIYN